MQYDAKSFDYRINDGSISGNSNLSFVSVCDNDHQLNAGITYTNASMDNKFWKLDSPVIKFWRDKDGSGTCYVFEQIK